MFSYYLDWCLDEQCLFYFQEISLPLTWVTLDGSGSKDDVNISSYAWSQVSGPNQVIAFCWLGHRKYLSRSEYRSNVFCKNVFQFTKKRFETWKTNTYCFWSISICNKLRCNHEEWNNKLAIKSILIVFDPFQFVINYVATTKNETIN